MEVEELINIVMEEAEESIKQSYQEGYKQGVLEYKPQMEYWKSLYNSSKNDKQVNTFLFSLCSFTFGCFIGSGITTLFTVKF